MRYVVDIDDTLIFSRIDENGEYILGAYNYGLINIINDLYEKGHEIILHTGRHWNHLSLTKEQLEKGNILYTTLIMGKPVGDYYIDDKAIKPENFIEEVINNG